ncbi:HEAT repeat domain-containing protein [uncultured Methanospirillum sp.]|uniref:HEAT repeat domain-containing protein n=1 Tax=uncultured Methanospirillum sp. TaxID=262503 RepID=UPI0029C6CF6B|nr:HEAT repeat domain-containing protein [uncultured Methanospirillum sp.]
MITLFRPDPERMRLKGDLDGLIKIVRTSPDTPMRVESALALGRMQTPRAVPELIALLGDPDPRVVDAASEALEFIGKPAVRPLIETFNSADETVTRWLHRTLLRLGPSVVPEILACTPILNEAGEERAAYTLLSYGKPVLPIIVSALGSEERRTARMAEAMVETAGRDAVPYLIQALDSPDDEVRARSAALLILLGDQVVVDLLSSCAQDRDETRDLKFYIIQEIGRPALEPLYDSLKDPNPVTSSMALKVFMEIGDAAIVPLIRGIYDEDPEIRAVSENALIRIGEPVVEHLIREIPLHKESDREQISSVLIRIGEPGLPKLTQALFNPSADIARTVSGILPRLGSLSAPWLLLAVEEKGDEATGPVARVFREMGRLAFPILEEAIPTRGGKTATFAIRMLREIDPVRAIDPLIDSLSNHDNRVREAAMDELMQMGDMVTPRFIHVLSSGNENAAMLADTALRQMGSDAAPDLADALGDPLSADPSKISSILSDIGTDAVPYLIPMIVPGSQGQIQAYAIIKNQGAKAVPELLDALGSAGPDLTRGIKELLAISFEQDPGVFIEQMMKQGSGASMDAVSEIIRASPEQVIPHLIELINTGDTDQIQFAGDLLEKFGDAAIKPLINSLRQEEDEEQKLVLTSFLVKMGPAAVPALIEELRDPMLVVYAVAALGSIGEPAVPTLMNLLRDQDQEVVNYAGLSLARIGQPAIPALFSLFNEDKSMVPLISSIFANMGGVALPRLLDEFKALETTGEQGSERGISLMSMILDISMNDAPQMHHLFSLNDPEMQRMLTGILVSKGTAVIDPLIGALLSWTRPTPTLVLQTFASMKGQVITRVHQVMEQLPDRDLRRIPLIHLLGDLMDPSSASIIFKALEDSDRRIRIAAVRELGKFGREALDPLTSALQDEDREVRVAAIESMGDIGLPVLDQLLGALKDEDGEIRAAAINGIGKIGEPAMFMLIQALTDSDRRVRQDVVRLLQGFGWKPKYTTDRLSYLFAREDWDTLVKIGPPSMDILARGLKDSDPEVSNACREALKQIKSRLPTV